jgi:hypothetical protein
MTAQSAASNVTVWVAFVCLKRTFLVEILRGPFFFYLCAESYLNR